MTGQSIARAAALALAAAVLCGCGTGRLAPETTAAVNLAGTWKLNRQASEDPRPMLDRIQRDLTKRMRRMRPDVDDEIPGDRDPQTGGGSSSSSRRQRGNGSQQGSGNGTGGLAGIMGRGYVPRVSYVQALESQLSSDGLTIEQSPTSFSLIRGDWRRTFTPGGQSVVSVAEGVADQRSGWKGREYVIDVKPQVGPHVTERYGLSADNRQLVEKITLTDEDLPKLEFTRVYERGTPAPHDLPTSN